MIAEPALMCQGGGVDLTEALSPVVAAPGEDPDRLVHELDLHPVAVELDLVKPAFAARYLLDGRRERGFDEAGERGLRANRRRFFPHNRKPATLNRSPITKFL